jgi:hypothetical protein
VGAGRRGEAGPWWRRTLNGSDNVILRYFVDNCIFHQVELLFFALHLDLVGALFITIQFSFFFLYLVLSCFVSVYGASNYP